MAQKALKTLAARNTAILNRTHLIALALHSTYWLLRFTLTTRRSLPYTLLTLPSAIIEIWFERIGRPILGDNGEVKRSGEDLEAKGLTEWMWDCVYWTWGCLGLVAVVGDWAWWLWLAVPVYSAYLGFSTFQGARQGLGGLGGGDGAGAEGEKQAAQSKRSQKMEQRGGRQKVQYR
ncbi:hypothetical protein MBLNU230_g3172t1 [Neophaeotheca triangularis]